MIVTRRIALRIALILLATVVLQASFFSTLSLFGAAPNIVPVVIVALGLLGGAVIGAVCGFATGFVLDSVLLQTLGVSSLVLLSVGYLAGRYREAFEITRGWMPAALAGAFTLLASGGFAVVQLMLGVDAPVSLLALREVVVQALLAVALAFAIYPLVRRVVAPALIDYTPARRVLVPGLRRRAAGRRRKTRSARAHEARRRHPPRGRVRTPVGGGLG